MKTNFKKGMIKRMGILLVVVVFLFGFDSFRILYLQVVRGDELSAKAESQQLLDTEVSAMRGNIYDDSGNILAQSATVWNVFIDPGNITTDEKRNLVVDGLSQLLGFKEDEKQELLEKSKKDNHYSMVAEKVENSVKEKIADYSAEHKLGNIIGMEQTTRRYYPYGDFASSVLGFVGGDEQGLSGIEAYYDEELSGTNGRIITVKDSKGNKLPSDYQTSIEAKDGNSLVLTINQDIQYYLEKGLRQTFKEYNCKGAYGVVMDCKTGAVLGMCSLPDFDCNEPYKITNQKAVKYFENKLREEKEAEKNKKDKDEKKEVKVNGAQETTTEKPKTPEEIEKEIKTGAQSLAIQNQWRNFSVSDTYVPGSVFKTFMASMALEENVVSLDTTYTCTGSIHVADHTMKCHYRPGHGTQNLTQGLENSCNPFFITIGQKLGVHNYFKYFDAFGFTKRTNIDLPGEAVSQYVKEENYGIVELSSASFGQTNSLTPIQVCTGICAIANGGILLKPYVVSEIKDSEGNTVKKTEKTELRRVISEDTSEKVRKMMKSVVENGTGKNGYVAGYSVGGKTGTSTKLGESKAGEKDKYIVSFAAIAPSYDPEVAMIILIDEPNEDLGGGALCAPIAAQVVEQAMQVRNIEPRYDDEDSAAKTITTPNVVGESVDDAKKALDSDKLKYKIVGKGKKILSQSPVPGGPIPVNGRVVLYTDNSAKKTVKVPDFTSMTISQANEEAAEAGLNIQINGNSLSAANVVAYRQSVEKNTEIEMGSVVIVTFKSNNSVLD